VGGAYCGGLPHSLLWLLVPFAFWQKLAAVNNNVHLKYRKMSCGGAQPVPDLSLIGRDTLPTFYRHRSLPRFQRSFLPLLIPSDAMSWIGGVYPERQVVSFPQNDVPPKNLLVMCICAYVIVICCHNSLFYPSLRPIL